MTRAIVDGLERYVGCQWKGIQCDGCGANYTGVTGVSDVQSDVGAYIRKRARADGWLALGGEDLCPNCAQNKRPKPGP